MLTGTLPHQHGIHTHNRDYRSLDRSRTLLSDLDHHRAIGASANVFAGEAFGFDHLFDEFTTVSNICTFPDGLDLGEYVSDASVDHPLLSFVVDSLRQSNRGQNLANGVLAGLDHLATGRPVPNVIDAGGAAVVRAAREQVTEADEPFFLFLNLLEAHTPLVPTILFDRDVYDTPWSFSTTEQSVWDLMHAVDDHETYVKHWRQLYVAAVDYLDRKISTLVDWLAEHTDRQTTVVITSDHGENLGYPSEEGYVRHKSSMSEGLLHVPLLVLNPPEGTSPPTDRYVSHLELRQFLTGLAHDELCDPTTDRLAAELVGMSAGPDPPSDDPRWDRMIRCVYDGTTKLCWDSLGTAAAYDLDPDRPNWQSRKNETVDPSAWEVEFFETDVETAKREAKATRSRPTEVSEATKARLKKLGYR